MIPQHLIEIITACTGLQVQKQHTDVVWEKIQGRMKALKLSTPEQYYHRLTASADAKGTARTCSDSEWRQLILLLTTGESYFFRDQGQCTLLRQRILPELIQRQRQQTTPGCKPTLRIWSAGCSTGEEAYSLAILINELIPDLTRWNLLILGTDINSDGVEKARKGRYNEWSFRSVPNDVRSRYFRPCGSDWEIDPQIRKLVTFRVGNLVQDPFPNALTDLHQMDLIVCRNVFIYFSFATIATVLEKLNHTLIPGGYLVTGHTELHNQNLHQLQTRVFPESIVYQRTLLPEVNPPKAVWVSTQQPAFGQPSSSTTTAIALSAELVAPIKTPAMAQSDSDARDLQVVESCLQSGDYAGAIQVGQQAIVRHPRSFQLHQFMASAYANLGKHEEAVHYCQQAIQIDSLTTDPYYLLAHIAQEQGQFEQAKSLFKRIIYLDPTAITAYLELSFLYEKEGDNIRARKMQHTALGQLQKLPAAFPVAHQDEMTAGKLLEHLQSLLSNAG